MRKRYKDAGITLEQIIDGTTGCHVWFHIDVAERECFMSEEEQIDGSVILNISGIEDWATIPPGFYQLGGREVRGANTCVFGSFIAEGKAYTLLKSIPAQEVVEQAFFESLICEEVSSNNTAQVGDESLEDQPNAKQGDQLKSTDPKAVRGQGIFPFSKSALVSQYRQIWPTIEADIRGASKNGLVVAKAGKRKWHSQIAFSWAQANNKIKDRTSGSVGLPIRITVLSPALVAKLWPDAWR